MKRLLTLLAIGLAIVMLSTLSACFLYGGISDGAWSRPGPGHGYRGPLDAGVDSGRDAVPDARHG